VYREIETRFLRWRPHVDVHSAIEAMVGRLERLQDGREYSWLPFLKDSASEHELAGWDCAIYVG
jgi:hypothetical protein